MAIWVVRNFKRNKKPQMPENWKTCKLGDISEIIMGQSPKGATTNNSGKGLPLLNGPTEFGYSYPTPTQFTVDPKKVSQIGDLLFCVRGSTTGKMNFSDQPYAIGRGIGVFRGKNGFSTKYIKYLIDLYLDRMLAMCTGSTFPNLSRSDLVNFNVQSFSPKESNVIASILSALDDKIELNLQINKTLEEMAMALYKHWFVDFGSFREGEFVATELGEIPKGWEVKTLDDEFKITIGRTPPRKEKEWFSSENGIKWISIKDMGNCGTYIFNTSEYLTEEAVVKKNVPQVPANTVILSFKLTVGRVAITTENMVTNEAIAHFLKKKNTLISAEYLYSALKSFDYNSLGSTSSIATAVNSKTVKSMKILVPAKPVIDNFQQEILSVFELIKSNSKEIQSLTQLRDTLLPKLISGEVRVKDAEKTLSEVL